MSKNLISKIEGAQALFADLGLRAGSNCSIRVTEDEIQEAFGGFEVNLKDINISKLDELSINEVLIELNHNGLSTKLIAGLSGVDLEFPLTVDLKNKAIKPDFDSATSQTVLIQDIQASFQNAKTHALLVELCGELSIDMSELEDGFDVSDNLDIADLEELFEGCPEGFSSAVMGRSMDGDSVIYPSQASAIFQDVLTKLDAVAQEESYDLITAVDLEDEDAVFELMNDISQSFNANELSEILSVSPEFQALLDKFIVEKDLTNMSENLVEIKNEVVFDSSNALDIESHSTNSGYAFDVTVSAGGPGLSYQLETDDNGSVNNFKIEAFWGLGSKSANIYDREVLDYMSNAYGSELIQTVDLDNEGMCR